MTPKMHVMLEIGPNKKKYVAGTGLGSSVPASRKARP